MAFIKMLLEKNGRLDLGKADGGEGCCKDGKEDEECNEHDEVPVKLRHLPAVNRLIDSYSSHDDAYIPHRSRGRWPQGRMDG